MSRKLICVNANCMDAEPMFNVEIEVSQDFEVARNLHFTQYPINHFTCACCGQEAVEVKA